MSKIALFRGQPSDVTSANSVCPSLYTPTAAQDGKLVRIRIPGGWLNSNHCRALAEILGDLKINSIDVTNRANLQIRGLKNSISPEILLKLQNAGLAAPDMELDRFRNIMASPTAGIDPNQLTDTRPLVTKLNEYISSNLNLIGLSPKFSIGIDGGEKVSIQQQPNDILLKAVALDGDRLLFHLYLAGIDTETAIAPVDCIPLIGAIAQVYLNLVPQKLTPKPRLKQIIEEFGISNFLSSLPYLFPSTDVLLTRSSFPLGIHRQKHSHLSYIGLALPLGRLKIEQLQKIAEIIDSYGSGSLCLTPWRGILIPDLENVDVVLPHLEAIDLSVKNNNIWGGLVACSGNTGCTASFTDTQADAITLAQYIADKLSLDRPVTIHFSGCPKSCAHHGSSDFTLVGTSSQGMPRYHLYAGDEELPFGKLVLPNLDPSHLPTKIGELLSIYRETRDEVKLC